MPFHWRIDSPSATIRFHDSNGRVTANTSCSHISLQRPTSAFAFSSRHLFPNFKNLQLPPHITTMAFPPQFREVPAPLPSIVVPGNGANRFRDQGIPFSRSPAMAIPGIETRDDVPPPLPPPRNLPFGDAPTQFRDDFKDKRDFSRGSSFASRSSFASGYGSMSPCHMDDRQGYERRGTGSITSDEGYASYASTDRWETIACAYLADDKGVE